MQSYPTYPIAPAVKGGKRSDGIFAMRYCDSSLSSAGSGSASRPCLGPETRVLRGLAPTKLYRPMVWEGEADSKRNESLDPALQTPPLANQQQTSSRQSSNVRDFQIHRSRRQELRRRLNTQRDQIRRIGPVLRLVDNGADLFKRRPHDVGRHFANRVGGRNGVSVTAPAWAKSETQRSSPRAACALTG